MTRLVIWQGARFHARIDFDPPARMLRSDNLRVAPLDGLQTDVFRAFVETLPPKGGRS